MLAPRKTLWSTPDSVIARVVELQEQMITPILCSYDKVCDIGCGDGRCILQWATAYSNQLLSSFAPNDNNDATPTTELASFVGIDIDASRVEQAQSALEEARMQGTIHPNIQISFCCANALEFTSLFQDATFIFLYLIPRGLKIIKPYLTDHRVPRRLVFTYMSPLPEMTAVRVEKIPVPHQPGAAWPIYMYSFPPVATISY